MNGEYLMKEIFNASNPPIYKVLIDGIEREVVAYEHFKKMFIFSTLLRKKKDQQQIRVEVQKIKGLKKNDVNCFW
jgi:hypothetical protein